jgi:AcrR family transcriptional regulator
MNRNLQSRRRRDVRTGGDLAERRAEDKLRRRAEILDAAEAIVRVDGWEAMTMVQVARRARLSRALVYVYFRNQADLLLGIRDRGVETLACRLSEAAAQQTLGIAQLEAVLRASADFVEEHRIHFEAIVRGELLSLERCGRAAGHVLDSNRERCRHALAKAITTGVADGSIRPDVGEPEVVSAALWSFIYGVLRPAADRSSEAAAGQTALEPLLNQALELVLRSICRQPAAGPAAAILESLRDLGPSHSCPLQRCGHRSNRVPERLKFKGG